MYNDVNMLIYADEFCVEKDGSEYKYIYILFRCPTCNNKDEFCVEMKRMGVYIPEQDASWENGTNFQVRPYLILDLVIYLQFYVWEETSLKLWLVDWLIEK